MNKEEVKSFKDTCRRWAHNRRLVYTLVAIIVLVVGLLCYEACSHSGRQQTYTQLSTRDVLDSLEQMLPTGSLVIARYPDEGRHCLYYLNSGVMYYFDAKGKNLEEVAIEGFPSGSIVEAKLSKDEKYILLSLLDGDRGKIFRINTTNRNVVEYGDYRPQPKDSVETPKPKPVKEEPKTEEEAATEPVKPQPQPDPERESVLQGIMEEPAG